ncbi:substrate-binding domain-containing protein [Paraflavisolibacter sp. H34]|uniref:LacI family DNA-binding transcriptional regulator n=1 Tax=Huijunlia imazamoxiresistens TaxID=3127457 RepID=UPI00301A8E6B
MQKRVCLKDIAQKVGVSTALVSYVLNNQKVDRIRKEVAQKIKDTARELNYRTNHIAKSLKTNKTFTIGLIVADISNSFSSSLARIIEDEAEKNDYTVIFGSSDENGQKCAKLIQVFLNHQVDGLIIAPPFDAADQLRSLQQQNVPFVLIDRFFPGLEAPFVAIDNYRAAFSAVEHLLANGYRRIGFVGFDSPLNHLQERGRGYRDALRQHGLPPEARQIKSLPLSFTHRQVEQAIDELLALPEPVDALLFVSNLLSTHGLKYLNTLDLSVPADLGVVSFDQSDAADLFYAPLTHIHQPLREMGRQATQMLLESLGSPKAPARGVFMEAELVMGKSSRRYEVGNTK